MYLQYYTPLKTTLIALSSINHVDWFNNQYDRTEELNAIKYPAVFVDFESPTIWQDRGQGQQAGIARISFHVVVNSLADTPELADQKADEVHEALQNKSITTAAAVVLSTKLMRVESEIILDFDQIKVIKITYACELTDQSTQDCLVETNVTNLVTPSTI